MKKLIVICLAVVAGYFIWSLDTFQRNFFPKKYWAEKVSILESQIRRDKGVLLIFTFSLRKKPDEMKSKVEEQMIIATAMGWNSKEAVDIVVKNEMLEIEKLKIILKKLTEDLEKSRQLLEQARREFSKYK